VLLRKSIIQVIKSRRMRWVGHVARVVRGERYIHGFGGDVWGDIVHLEDAGLLGRMLLK
jgi:hypothetical protein